jgi:hypothetical protein
MLTAVATATAFFTAIPQPFHLVLGLAVIGAAAVVTGNFFFSKHGIFSVISGLGVVLVATALFTAVAYKLLDLSPLTNVLALLFAVLAVMGLMMVIKKPLPTIIEPDSESISQGKIYWITRSAAVLFVLLLASCFVILLEARTAIPLRSPWHVVPNAFFSLLLITNLLGLGLLKRRETSPTTTWLILASLSAIPLSIGVIVYATGLGFDPFIHQATEAHIAGFGAIEPKPWYYLGQYGLVVTLHRLTGVTITHIDQLLLPLASTIFLPLIALFAVRQFKTTFSPSHAFAAATLLALPLALFVITTPQGISYVLYLAVLALLLIEKPTQRERVLTWLITLTTIVTHPIAGVPALLLLSSVEASRYFKKSIFSLLSVVAIPILPLLFFLSGQNRTAAMHCCCQLAHCWCSLAAGSPGNTEY